jgi:membrane protein
MLHALAGGIVAAIVFVVMQRVFGLFLARIPTYTLIYGTFAALPIFLVWLYLSWVVILLGATLTATLPGFFERTRMLDAFPGDRAWAAMTMLVALAQAQRDGQTLAFDPLQTRARVSSSDGESLLGEMCDAGWVARTDEGHWLLTKQSGQIGVAEVVSRFALSPNAWQSASDDPISKRIAHRLADALRSADLPIAALVARRPEPSNDPPDDQIG